MRSSGSTPPAHSAPSSQPSLTKLFLNFSHSFILSIKRAFHPQITSRSASNNTDINLLVTTILLILSLISSWVLILAFLSLLPVIYSQLLTAQLPAAIPSSNERNIVAPSPSSSLSDTNNSPEPFQEGMGTAADAATAGLQKKKLAVAVPPSENVTSPGGGKKHRKAKKKVAKETWGLPTLRVIDSNGKVVPVNPDTPTPMETDCFKGFILIMLKCDGEHEEHDRYKHHFKGKQRKFEVQFQGKMKFVPQGEVILGGELADRMQVSFVTRSLLSFLMKFAMSLNPFLHFGFGDEPKPDGNFEYPHLTFPLFRVMDRVVVTAPGETPPELGRELPEVDSDRLLRRSGKGPHMSFQEDYTYSFSFHSMYIDFSRWSICNFPGYRAIDLRGFFGQQKVKVVCYELVDPKGGRPSNLPHYNAYKHYLLSLEMSHTCMMTEEELAAAEEEIVEDEDEPQGLREDEQQGHEEGQASAGAVAAGEAATQSGAETETEREIEDDEESSASSISDGELIDLDQHPQQQPPLPLEQQQHIDSVPGESDEESLSRTNSCGSLGTGAEYVTSNSVVSLISIPPPWDTGPTLHKRQAGGAEGQKGEDSDSSGGGSNSGSSEDSSRYADCYISIADVSGVALRKECTDTPIVRFIKPHSTNGSGGISSSVSHLPLSVRKLNNFRKNFVGNHKTSSAVETSEELLVSGNSRSKGNSNSVLCSGDEVMIQCASTGRYLTIHRGWWISWTAEDTGSKCLFSIQMMGPTGLSYAAKGTKLIAGKPFRLRSVRWSDWEVGYDNHAGVRTGQPVVLYQSKMLRNRSVKNHPAKWGKNNKLVNPLCLCVLPEMNSSNYSYLETSSSLLTNDSHPEGLAPALSPSAATAPTDQSLFPQLQQQLQLPPFLELPQENDQLGQGQQQQESIFEELDVHLSGWTEIFNRSLNHPQLAYCVQVKCRLRGSPGSSNELQHWTTFRTQRDFDELFAKIPSLHHSLLESPGNDLYGSPSPSAGPKKIELPKSTNANFSTVSARHQCSPDQSVHLMALRLKLLLGDQTTAPVIPSHSPSSSRDNSNALDSSLLSSLSPSEVSMSLHPRDAIFQRGEEVEAEVGEGEEKEGPPEQAISSQNRATVTATTRTLFLRALSKRSLLDLWFLRENGGIEKYISSPVVLKRSIQTALIARALWDTHWREEIAVLYPTHLAFYSPMAKKASCTLSLQELIGISHVPDDKSPLVGKAVLKIETIGRVHYLAFFSKESCHSLSASILEHFSGVTFENSLPSFVDTTDPRDRFVLKSGRWRPAGRRLVLNARRFTFDLDPPPSPVSSGAGAGGDQEKERESPWEFSARLLKTVFQLDRNNSIHLSSDSLKSEPSSASAFASSVSAALTAAAASGERGAGGATETMQHIDVSFETDADGLFPGREKIISFLDETVRLKLINLQSEDMDLSSVEAVCFFVNIFHTLLIHARLVLNPPSTQDWATFFENVSYEIGGDVFSLSELEHCVIAGKLNRPILLPRHFCSPPQPQDDHFSYALLHADRRVRFALNHCSVSCPNTIRLLTPNNFILQLDGASVAMFQHSLVIDMKRRTVTLPKLCEMFRNDFGGINTSTGSSTATATGNNHRDLTGAATSTSVSQERSQQERGLEVLRFILRYLERESWEKVTLLLNGPKPPVVKFQEMEARSHDSLQLMTSPELTRPDRVSVAAAAAATTRPMPAQGK